MPGCTPKSTLSNVPANADASEMPSTAHIIRTDVESVPGVHGEAAWESDAQQVTVEGKAEACRR